VLTGCANGVLSSDALIKAVQQDDSCRIGTRNIMEKEFSYLRRFPADVFNPLQPREEH